MKYLIHPEMDIYGGHYQVRRTYEEAIQYQRAYLKQQYGVDYQSDELALADYIAVNWASTQEDNNAS